MSPRAVTVPPCPASANPTMAPPRIATPIPAMPGGPYPLVKKEGGSDGDKQRVGAHEHDGAHDGRGIQRARPEAEVQRQEGTGGQAQRLVTRREHPQLAPAAQKGNRRDHHRRDPHPQGRNGERGIPCARAKEIRIAADETAATPRPRAKPGPEASLCMECRVRRRVLFVYWETRTGHSW